MQSISFITANYVARALGYPGGTTSEWSKHDKATKEAMSAEGFMGVARDIANAGFEAVDIWMAHCHWREHNREDYLEQVKGICSNFDFRITSYAGGLREGDDVEAVLRFMKQLGAPILAGGYWGGGLEAAREKVNEICGRLGLKWAYENHPEKTPEEILEKIGQGKFKNIGVALDTGWCGTQGMDAVACAKAVREHLLLVHLKDVAHLGGEHETCALGD